MVTGLKLALPLFKSTLRWMVALTMLTVAMAAWALDSVGIGLGASAGAGALLVLSAALGLNLRRCRARALACTLPGFPRTGLVAVGTILVCMVALIGALDGWKPESLLALLAAAAFGLGFGLSFPPAWMSPIPLILMLWFALEDLDPAMIWSSSWSPLVAPLGLLLTYVLYTRTRKWDCWWVDDVKNTAMAKSGAGGRQPYRLGHLLSVWPALSGVAMGAILGVALAVASVGDEVFARINPIRQVDVAGYLVLFSGFGVLTMLTELLGNGPQVLRRLAVLPGWSRERLFIHAELSCWRIGLWLLLALAAGLFMTGLWAGNSMWGLWLQGLLTCWVVLLLGIYAGLWLTCVPGALPRLIVLMITFVPLLLIAVVVTFADPDLTEDRSAWGGPMVLAASLALAWWLRHQARSAWASISFNREG